MGISFDDSPNEPLFAKSASSVRSQGDVVMTIAVELDGLPARTVDVQIVLEAEIARALAGQMGANAQSARNWLKTDPRDRQS